MSGILRLLYPPKRFLDALSVSMIQDRSVRHTILGPKAPISGTVNISSGTQWQELILEVIGVVPETDPRFTMSILCKSVINSSDTCWCIDIGNIIAEVEEIVVIICWIPL